MKERMTMKRQNIYETLQQYKSSGMSCLKASELLNIDYKTAHKYWKMSREECQDRLLNYTSREKKSDQYRDEALSLLRRAPYLSAAQIAECICANHGIDHLNVSDRAFWNYISALRKEYNIPKNALEIIHNGVATTCNNPSIHERIAQKKAVLSSSQPLEGPKDKVKSQYKENIGL